ncbi:radical SAM protein, partial [archaeon]|nr:radical SAM protein [archaeon]
GLVFMKNMNMSQGKRAGIFIKSLELMRFFYRTRIMGRHVPLIASFKLTYRCNLSCRACPFHRKAQGRGAHMGWSTALACLDELKRMGCMIIIFEGGEPLLWKDGGHDFNELALHARKNFLCVGATTNGTVCLDVPTDVIWVSVDGDSRIHDSLRNGTHARLMENIRESSHRRLYAHTTLNRTNWSSFPAIVEDLSSLGQVRGVTVQFFYPYNQGEDDLSLSDEERGKAVEMVIGMKRKGHPIMNSVRGLKSMIRNDWQCHDWLLANVDPDGRIETGCYVKNRGEINCRECGFTPVAEASGAYDLSPGSLHAGWRLFLS